MKKYKKCFALILFLVFMAYVPLFVFDKLKDKKDDVGSYQGIVNLWHIETFEGGSGSRAEFLKKRAIEFESKNKGVLVSVQTYSEEQLLQKLSQGDKFDLISFSCGVGCEVRDFVSPYIKSVSVRDDLLQGGMLDGKVYALPWAFGGYALFATDSVISQTNGVIVAEKLFDYGYQKKDKHKTKVPSLAVGFAQYTNPFKVVQNLGVVAKKDEWSNDLSTTGYQAYQAFCDGKFALLLGTQRDLSRVELKQSQGKMQNVVMQCFGGYTDLVQYVAYSNNNEQKAEISQMFMQFLTSEKSQQKLTSIQMFSPVLDIYSGGLHLQMQQTLARVIETPNVFADKQVLNGQKQKTLSKVGI